MRRLRLGKRSRLWTMLPARIVREGDLVELIQDAVLRQDLRWVQDQLAGRPSVV